MIEAVTRQIWTPRVAPPSTVYAETAQSVEAQLTKGGGVVLEADGQPVGSGRWVPVAGPGGAGIWMEVKRIGVLPSYTGRQLGAGMLAALEGQGQVAGAEGAQLAVRYDQTRLVSYYTELGYTPADDVTLTTINHETPPPIGMRKRF